MASKIYANDLKVGMFVAELDRPWVDTPFLLQGFLIENDEQLLALRTHCEWVIVDRARSTGAEYEAVAGVGPVAPNLLRMPPRVPANAQHIDPDAATPLSSPSPVTKEPARPSKPRTAPRGSAQAPAHAAAVSTAEVDTSGYGSTATARGPGFLSRLFSGLKGRRKAPGEASSTPAAPEVFRETPQEFAARAELIPAGLEVQTYQDQVTVEEEVPLAQAAVTRASGLLEKLVADIKLGASFEIERVEEIVEEMVESVVRNPDAAMWIARLREEDISTYGHGLQVSVYLTAFGRHLGFPKPQLEQLAQIGLLLDIGKIKLPRYLLEKQGRLTAEEYEEAKRHVQHGIDILSETANIDPEVIEGIEQHHERMNGSGYPNACMGDEIGIYGRMAGIVDTFAALTNHRPYAAAASSYEALRSINGWAGEFFHEPLVQQFVSSIGVFPVGSLIELSSGEVAIVVAHNKVRRLKPRVLVVTGPDKTRSPHPAMLDLLYDNKSGGDEPVYIKRGLPAGAYGLDLKDFYLA
ncbi:MAG TPA: HD domain-containing phosphohydrolase [Usitatibacter sp.]|nr:HD domain-containing phosphohydrolase [Usitatibacter sp.]